MIVPDELSDLRLSAGAFADTFQQPFELGGGAMRTFDYAIRVQVGGQGIRELSVKVGETDPAGAATMTCDAGSVTWTARSG